VFWGDSVTAAQWEELRAPTWGRWLDDADRDWPPHAAILDGISGEVLRRYFASPENYVGHWDARPQIVSLADTGLAELARFRQANPTAARSIKAPLAAYERRLRAVRKRPESRLLAS
jgi:hypothetical protein